MATTEVATTVMETPQQQQSKEPQQAVPQLPHHKVKVKKPLQRSCNEKDEKGKLCGGHLKRWFYLADVVEQKCGDVAKAWGPNAEVYRCEHCKTLYLPNQADPRGINVAGKGMISVFGLTVAPKEPAPKAPAKEAPKAAPPAAKPATDKTE